MKEISLVFILQCVADVINVAGNVSVTLVRVTFGFTDHLRSKLFCWATWMFVGC